MKTLKESYSYQLAAKYESICKQRTAGFVRGLSIYLPLGVVPIASLTSCTSVGLISRINVSDLRHALQDFTPTLQLTLLAGLVQLF